MKLVSSSIKKSNILLLLIFLIGCASIGKGTETSKEFLGIDERAEEYIALFKEIAEPYINKSTLESLSVGFKDVEVDERGVVGVCKYFTSDGGPEILIDQRFWAKSTENTRESLMLHELGHCICKIPHSHIEGSYEEKPKKDGPVLGRGFFRDGCPVTVMYPEVLGDFCYEKHKYHYHYELRLRCKIYSKSR